MIKFLVAPPLFIILNKLEDGSMMADGASQII